MRRILISLPLLALVACAGATAPDATVPPPTTAAPTADGTSSSLATAEPTAMASATPPEPKVELLDLPAKCKAACERNGAKCDKIDVPACIKRCTETMEPAQPLCPQKMRTFWDCVDADELRCKEGDKIRAQGCDKEALGLMACLMNASKTPEERCKSECAFDGRCTLTAGECTATSQADCDRSRVCADLQEGQICKLSDKGCDTELPPDAE